MLGTDDLLALGGVVFLDDSPRGILDAQDVVHQEGDQWHEQACYGANCEGSPRRDKGHRRCHAQNAARPSGFPQVDIADHSGGESCVTCHVAHNPGLE